MTWDRHNHTRSVPYRLQQACFRRDRWTCQRCGYIGRQSKGDLHADHITPRAEGGEDELDNLQTLCVDCHRPRTRQQQRAGMNKWRRPKEPPPGLIT